jgi:hypothetical protein
MYKFLFVFLISFTPVFSSAYEPFLTDDASTVKKGKHQFDFYYYNIFNKSGSNSCDGSTTCAGIIDINVPGEEFLAPDRAIGFPLGYTYGLNERTEISFGMTYYGFPTGSYSPLTNYTLGAKYRFYNDEDRGIGLAIKPSFYFPNGTDHQTAGLGMSLPGYGVNLIGAYDKQNYSILVNFAYQHQPYNTNYSVAGTYGELRTELFQLSIAPIWNVSERLHLGLDIGLVTDITPTDDRRYNSYIMPAVTYSPTEDIDLGISYLRVAQNFRDQIGTGYSSIFKAGVSYRF